MRTLSLNLNKQLLSITLFLMIALCYSYSYSQDSLKDKVILAVFAHPDDEGTVSPILARYLREGVKVHLVIVTDGRYGTNDHTDHESGEELVFMRKEEMKCAASKLGVELIHLDYHDQLRANEGFDGHVPHARSLIKELYDIVTEIKPDVIITWGPDGSSNHMDHRLVGASMTQIVVNKVWDNSISLYYYGRPSDHLDSAESKILRGQDKRYLTTRISYTDEDIEKAYNSIMCHKSQIRPTTLEAYKARKTKNGAAVYLRKFIAPPTKITYSIFE